jgi:hypothetical protein
MTTQTKLLVAILVLAAIAVVLLGFAVYRTFHVPPPEPTATEVSAPAPAAKVEASPAGEKTPSTDAAAGAAGKPDFAQFAKDGYKAVCSDKGDLLGDGNTEWILGYQSTKMDDMQYPTSPAYFAFVRQDKASGGWSQWFTINAPNAEAALDEHSIRSIGAKQGNQVFVELMFYGFGVSSRPEPVCLYAITPQGAKPATKPFPIAKTSDDVVVSYDVTPNYPGDEELLAQAVMGGEAHAAAHRYKVTTYGWKDGVYVPVNTKTTGKAYDNGIAAIENMFSVDFN